MIHRIIFIFLLMFSLGLQGSEVSEFEEVLSQDGLLGETAEETLEEDGLLSGTVEEAIASGFEFKREEKNTHFNFKGAPKSLIQWDKLEHKKWLSLDYWKKAQVRKEQEPNWRLNLIERRLKELVGHFVECIGDCRIYRGEGFSLTQYNSRVRELDEVITMEDSYAWISLVDGTLVRVSPNSSLSFKEINIGAKENFVHLRVNSGNILVLNRLSLEVVENDLRETDQIFLPLSFNDANPIIKPIKYNEDDLSNFIEDRKIMIKHRKKLNKLIKKNNKIINDKPTYTMVIMPNGTVFGKDLHMEFIVLLGGASYVKQRALSQQNYNLSGTALESNPEFYFRGFENREVFNIEKGRWYQIDPTGRVIETYTDDRIFRLGEFVTKLVPSIMMARELFIKKHSQFIFKDLNRKELAEEAGYRLWGELNKNNDDLNMRVKYLKEYTRRLETTNLVVARQFRRKAKERGELTKSMLYDEGFYDKALNSYILKRELDIGVDTDSEVLNSTKKPFWRIINAKKNR